MSFNGTCLHAKSDCTMLNGKKKQAVDVLYQNFIMRLNKVDRTNRCKSIQTD